MMCNLHSYCILYCMCVITSEQGATAEADTIREQQAHVDTVKNGVFQNTLTAAEVDEVGKQQLKQMQSGHSSVQPCKTSARQRHYRTKLHQTHVHRCGEGSETTECLQQRESCRTPCCANTNGSESSSDFCTVKELQVPDCSCRQTKGYLESVDWTTGLEYWNGLSCCKKSLFVGMSAF